MKAQEASNGGRGRNEGTISGTTSAKGSARAARGPQREGTTKRKKRRIRSPHPGVKLKRRTLASGAISWRAHYVDPDTGREVAITLEALAVSTKEARENWAKQKAAEIARTRMDRAVGKGPTDARALDEAIKNYFETARVRLKTKTIKTHELALARLREWAKREGVRSTADLTRPRLSSLRDYLIRAPKRVTQAGEKRGTSKATKAKRSPVSVNRELASIKALCNVWRARGMLPNLHRDDLADALAALPVPREQPAYLSPTSLKNLFESAKRYDEACFDETREEHAGERPKGTTPKFIPVASFLATLLLTGMRRGEALAIEWSMIDLDALDHEGRKVGEIRLPASIVKTHRARTVGLEVSPGLRRLLAAMKLRASKGRVFALHTGDTVEKARRRMMKDFGAPPFDWQTLRSTCATFLTNAPGIFGAATAFMSAKQLGHSVQVAERHYLGVHRGIPRDARSLEAAMQIESELADVLGACVTAPGRAARA